MDDTNTVTPPTLENMYVMAGQEFDRPVLQAEDRDNVEGRRDRGRCLAPVEASKTTDQDPLRNPAILFQDREDSYTPTTLAEMLQQQESPAKVRSSPLEGTLSSGFDLADAHLRGPACASSTSREKFAIWCTPTS